MVKSASRYFHVEVLVDITATVASSENVSGTKHGPEVTSQEEKRQKLMESDKMAAIVIHNKKWRWH